MIDFDILDTKTLLGESSFYLYKSNEVVFLDLLNPSIYFYSINLKKFTKIKLDLPKPLGNVYPLNNGKFLISCFEGLYIFDRKKNKTKKYIDVREKNQLKDISYNDGTISQNKIWIGLSHKKETQNIGYFGYLQNKKFFKIDRGFKVTNGPAINEKLKNLYFSDSFNSSIYEYSLNNFKRNIVYKYKKKDGFPDGIALDNQNGLWVAHWAGAKISRINLKTKKIDIEIKIPALNVTSIAFIGKKLNHLFVTTGKIETPKSQLKYYNHSGSTFIIKTDFSGLQIPYSSFKL